MEIFKSYKLKEWIISKIRAMKNSQFLRNWTDSQKFLGTSTYTLMNVKEFKHIWILENFRFCSEEPGQAIDSSKFSTPTNEELQWFLQIYPNGDKKANKGYISIFLVSCNKSPVKAQLEISILNGRKKEIRNLKTDIHNFTQGNSWGYSTFISKQFLLKKTNEFMNGNNLIILCKITIFGDKYNVSGKYNNLMIKESTNKLQDEFDKLFESKKFSDIILMVDGQECQAHKAILAARSNVFRAMFEHKMKEQETNCVDIIDINFNVFKDMIRFMYTGRVSNLEQENAIDLLIAADKYGLEDLVKICEELLFQKLSITTAAETLVISDLYSLNELKIQAINFIRIHILEIMKTNGWKMLKKSHSDLVDEVFQSFFCKKLNTPN